jgi:hypothetical protein
MQRYYLDESPSSSNQNLIVHKTGKKGWIWSANFLEFWIDVNDRKTTGFR